jgi:uncharacterized protein YdcH (DUF465 family)
LTLKVQDTHFARLIETCIVNRAIHRIETNVEAASDAHQDLNSAAFRHAREAAQILARASGISMA